MRVRPLVLAVIVSLPSIGLWEGLLATDCDGDGIDNAEEVSAGATDCNENGVPDECETTPLQFGRRAIASVAGGSQVGVLDWDGDGVGEIAMAVSTEEGEVLRVFSRSTDGTYTSEDFPVSSAIQSHTTGDVDGDGRLDIVVLDRRFVHIAFGRDTGDAAVTSFDFESLNSALAAADLDGDGRSDILLGAPREDGLYVRMSNGRGSFREPRLNPTIESPGAIATGDFDGDGTVDAAVGGRGGISILLEASPDGVFGHSSLVPFDAGLGPDSVVALDTDVDGQIDLAVLHDARVFFYRGGGTGDFELEAEFALPPRGFRAPCSRRHRKPGYRPRRRRCAGGGDSRE